MHSVVMSATGSTATETGVRRKEEDIVKVLVEVEVEEVGACRGAIIPKASTIWTSSWLMLYRYEAYSEPG
jgi:hypothetical protein